MIKNISTATFGLGFSAILGLIYFALLGRALGPSQFGIMITVQTFLLFAVDIVELVQNTTLVRASGDSSIRIAQIVKESLISRLKGSIFMTILGILLAYPVAYFFKNDELLLPFLIVFIGYTGFLLHGLILGYFQVTKKFRLYAIFLILNSALRLLLWFLFITLGLVSLVNAVVVFIAAVWLTVALGWHYLPKGFLAEKIESVHFESRRIRGLTGFFLLAATQGRLDTPLILRFSGSIQAGLYGAAQRIWLPIPSVLGAISTVFAPEFAQVSSRKDIWNKVKRMIPYMLLLLTVILVALPLFPWLLTLFGSSFKEAVRPGQWYGASLIVSILSLPCTTFLMYTVKATKALTLIGFMQLSSMVLFGMLLIPSFGAVGAALTVFLTTAIAFCVLVVASLRNWQNLPL